MHSILDESISLSNGSRASLRSNEFVSVMGIFLRYLVKHRVATSLTEIGAS